MKKAIIFGISLVGLLTMAIQNVSAVTTTDYGNGVINANNTQDTGETTLPIADQKNALTVNVAPPSGDAFVSLGNNEYSAQFKGTLSTTLNMYVGLDLYIGENPAVFERVYPTMFPRTLIMANSVHMIEFIKDKLQPGTTYYYKIKEKTKNFDATQVGQFTTPGVRPAPTQPVVIQPFDPNAATGFINYEYPTQLGEPVGDIAAPVEDVPTLVPCGKLSDRGTVDEYCNFGHLGILVGNVIRFMLAMLIPLTALACVYTGVQMIIHRTIPEELVKYKSRLLKIVVGLAIMLLAWTIVATVMKAILGPDVSKYLLLKIL